MIIILLMASRKDYYDILGIRRDASEEEIEKAYRKLTRTYHRDLHQSSFREISEAYETLSNKEKRERYDRSRCEIFSPALWEYEFGGPEEGDEDLSFEGFEDVVAGDLDEVRKVVPPHLLRGKDIFSPVKIGFEEATRGTLKEVKIGREVPCRRCFGKGFDPRGEQEICRKCAGAGQVQIGLPPATFLQIWSRCRGRGKVEVEPCSDCSGKGIILQNEKVLLEIPPGVDRGCRIFLRGKGQSGRQRGPSGDLVVQVEIEDHPLFHRKGSDLHVEVPLNMWEAALGGEVEVPTLEGPVVVTVPPGTQWGQEVRLSGKGIPFLYGRGRGDQVISFRVMVPQILPGRSKEILEELRRLYADEAADAGKP